MSFDAKKTFKIDSLQILDETGHITGDYVPDLSQADLKKLYELMVLTRVFDEKAISLQRQGRLGTYASIRGQEAISVGAGFMLRHDDWFFPAFRDYGTYFARDYPIVKLLLYWAGDERGGMIPPDQNIFTVPVPVGTQIPHAVGAAWTAKIRKLSYAVLVFCGDGATSKGDFHEGLNIAGVFQLPLIVIVQNNQWAISVPRTKQTAAETIAQKAIAYGIPGIQIDGNDIFAVIESTKNALYQARAGKGPTLIEAVTYRMGDHTTADDASRYRSDAELKKWKKRDPIRRLEKYLKSKKIIDSKYVNKVRKNAKSKIEAAVKEMEALPPPNPDSIFSYIYSRLPWFLEEQLQEFHDYLDLLREDHTVD
ncbi:MAG: pyruvate dehydrogenase (acetyl-transferring) E1 component subunit alpha [Candidatus Ranarchaeia archaeon]